MTHSVTMTLSSHKIGRFPAHVSLNNLQGFRSGPFSPEMLPDLLSSSDTLWHGVNFNKCPRMMY